LKAEVQSFAGICPNGIKRITIIGHGGPLSGVFWPVTRGRPERIDAPTLTDAFMSDEKKGEVLSNIDLYACYSNVLLEDLLNYNMFPRPVTVRADKGKTTGTLAGKTTAPKLGAPVTVDVKPKPPTRTP
jgi:hypothetical protein